MTSPAVEVSRLLTGESVVSARLIRLLTIVINQRRYVESTCRSQFTMFKVNQSDKD